jgi:hypothetical protein
VFLGFLLAAAEESRHLEVPAAECAVGGALLEGGVELQHRQQRVLDRTAVSQSLTHPERLGERSHVGRHPEVALGAARLQGRGHAGRRDPLFEDRFALGLRGVSAQPVARARQLPGGVEVLRMRGEALLPEPLGPPGAREVVALRIQRIGVAVLRRHRRLDGGRQPWQPVVKRQRSTEAGEAPRWQGATTENTGSI